MLSGEGRGPMKKIVLILSMVTLIGVMTTPNQGCCYGIPVFDTSNMINQLRDLLQQIKQYQEAINQSTKLTQQYMQMIRDYQQVLRQYNHYLNQIKSVRHMISNRDWLRILRTIKYYYGKSKRSVIVKSDPESSNYESDMDTVLGQYGYVPRDPAEVEADARQLGIWTDQYGREVRKDWEKYELYKDRLRMVNRNANESVERLKRTIPEHANTLNSLGDESDLATMQAIAAQNLTIMNQMESLVQIQNQTLLNMEMEQAERAAESAKWRDAEINRLKNRQNTQLLGRDRWGRF